jgi:hypothetical protein
MIQALGRARAINRDTPEKALRVGLLNDVVLPLSVDRVLPWAAPSELVEPLALDGLVLTAPRDMAKGWPGIWKTAEHAKYTLKKVRTWTRRTTGRNFSSNNIILEKFLPVLSDERRGDDGGLEDNFSSIASVLYQRPGERQKLREAFFDLRLLSHPGAKLIEKLGEAYAALLHHLRRHEIPPLAGAAKVVANAVVLTLRKARYVLSSDYQQHKAYTGVGCPGRYALSQNPQALAAYDGSPGGITRPHVEEAPLVHADGGGGLRHAGRSARPSRRCRQSSRARRPRGRRPGRQAW